MAERLTLSGVVTGTTDRAVFMKFEDDGEEYSLPLSQVEVTFAPGSKTRARVDVPRWLAEREGLEDYAE
jgi:hypothetical protein